jgi:hypothetical protein
LHPAQVSECAAGIVLEQHSSQSAKRCTLGRSELAVRLIYRESKLLLGELLGELVNQCLHQPKLVLGVLELVLTQRHAGDSPGNGDG